MRIPHVTGAFSPIKLLDGTLGMEARSTAGECPSQVPEMTFACPSSPVSGFSHFQYFRI